jgi:hypothetical protein
VIEGESMSVEIKVSLGDIYITTTQDDSDLAIKEAMQTISNEVGVEIAISSQYDVVGDNYGDKEGESDDVDTVSWSSSNPTGEVGRE